MRNEKSTFHNRQGHNRQGHNRQGSRCDFRRAFPVRCLWAVGLAIGLCACGSLRDSDPYVWPAPRYGEPKAQNFSVYYSELRHDSTAVINVISEQCGERYTAARVIERPYRGTTLHPQVLDVACGTPAAPQQPYWDRTVDAGYLVQLKPPATP